MKAKASAPECDLQKEVTEEIMENEDTEVFRKEEVEDGEMQVENLDENYPNQEWLDNEENATVKVGAAIDVEMDNYSELVKVTIREEGVDNVNQ